MTPSLRQGTRKGAGQCRSCGRDVPLGKRGTMQKHPPLPGQEGRADGACKGSGTHEYLGSKTDRRWLTVVHTKVTLFLAVDDAGNTHISVDGSKWHRAPKLGDDILKHKANER